MVGHAVSHYRILSKPSEVRKPPVREFKRTVVVFRIRLTGKYRGIIDYLESRADIDTARLAYHGMSWGGELQQDT
jgi:dienelactone hydrolase